MRNLLLLFIICILTVNSLADGFAYSKGSGIINKIQETHQIAVINLKPGQADVSMYISINDIPEGQTITYVLPFWYKPDNFTMTEEKSFEKYSQILNPLQNKIKEANTKYTYSYKNSDFLEKAWTFLINPINYVRFTNKAIQGTTASLSIFKDSIVAYKQVITPHAVAKLYKINDTNGDLQKLLLQSGLPEKLAEPLKKYHTSYFAVMTLTGEKKETKNLSSKGIIYSFTHKLNSNKYIYPLGTGAAWVHPIPLTEVYLTCPDNMKLKVNAPSYGESIEPGDFDYNMKLYLRDFINNRSNDKYFNDDLFNRPLTSSSILSDKINNSIWHIKYFMTNPDTDITVEFNKKSFSMLSVLSLLLLNDTAPWVIAIFCLPLSYLMSYFIIYIPYFKKISGESNKTDAFTITVISLSELLLIEFLIILPFFSLFLLSHLGNIEEYSALLILIIFVFLYFKLAISVFKFSQNMKDSEKNFIFQKKHFLIRIINLPVALLFFFIFTHVFAYMYDKLF